MPILERKKIKSSFMCKFHQDIALDVAQNMDGSLDPLSFVINSLAIGTVFSIGDYIPEMPNISGYNTYALASKQGQKAFADSGLVYDANAFESYRHDTIGFLRDRTADIIKKHDISADTIKKIGENKKALRFVNKIPDAVYARFSDKSDNMYKNDTEKNLYHDLRMAAADYWDDAETQDILHTRFEFSVADNFTVAKNKTNPLLLRGYEALPEVVKEYGDCAKGICTGGGIGVVAHIGCIAKFGVLPLLGASSALTANPVLTFGVMTGLSVGGLALWQHMHNKRGTVPGKLEKFATYGATLAAFGIALSAHAQHIMPHGDDDQHNGPKTTIYIGDDGQEYLIRKDIICTGFGPSRVVQDTIPLNKKPTP